MLALIIPVLNEEEQLPSILNQLKQFSDAELIVVDGGSIDQSVKIAKGFGAKLVHTKEKRRSIQMNAGARAATAEYLFFIHADVEIPQNLNEEIKQFIQSGGHLANFRLSFDQQHWFLCLSAYFTRYSFLSVQFGDQGLLIRKDLFLEIGAYDENMSLLEDQDIIKRAIKRTSLLKLPLTLTVSARKYRKYGVFYLQTCYFIIYTMYRLNVRDELLERCLAWLLKRRE